MILIGNKTIGEGQPVFVIAELSGNHNGELARALTIVDAAADAGADAVKLQTYTADTITLNSDQPEFLVEWQGTKRSLYELYREAQTPWEWHEEIFTRARERGLACFSAPFDETAVDFLEKLGNPIYKVASFEVVDIPLLEKIGKTKKPVIISRGMASLEELELARVTLRRAGAGELVMLQCVSAYPAKPEEMHLQNIPDLAKRFGTLVGLSDHTLTDESAIAAVALGACVVEKHLTLARSEGGVDSQFSLEPEEFAQMVRAVRATSLAVGAAPSYERTAGEEKELLARKSLFAARDIKQGEVFTPQNIRSVRPSLGLPPKYYRAVLGKKATRDIPFATPLSWNLVEGGG